MIFATLETFSRIRRLSEYETCSSDFFHCCALCLCRDGGSEADANQRHCGNGAPYSRRTDASDSSAVCHARLPDLQSLCAGVQSHSIAIYGQKNRLLRRLRRTRYLSGPSQTACRRV